MFLFFIGSFVVTGGFGIYLETVSWNEFGVSALLFAASMGFVFILNVDQLWYLVPTVVFTVYMLFKSGLASAEASPWWHI